jgi:hypothetical protein
VPASPKEIQFRLRAGESVEQIAASSGMPLAKVERYAGPVLSERERVLEQVRNSFVGSVGRGSTEMRLGGVVDRRLAESVGVRPDSITWSARREPSGVWLVELSYVSHSRRRAVVWRYDGTRREVTAASAAATRLTVGDDGGAQAGRPSTRSTASPRTRPTGAAGGSTATGRSSTAGSATGAVAAPGAAAPDRGVGARSAVSARASSSRTARTGRPGEAPRTTAPSRTATERTTADRRTQAVAQPTAAAAAARTEQALAERAAAARKEQALAERAAKAVAERKAQVAAARTARAAAARASAEQAEQQAQAAAVRRAEASAQRRALAAEQRKAAASAAQRLHEQQVAVHAQAAGAETRVGPPTLRVVGGGQQRSPRERRAGSDDADRADPRAARPAPPPTAPPLAAPPPTAPPPTAAPPTAAPPAAAPRTAGRRATVPAWSDVLLSTGPVTKSAERQPPGD